MNILFEKSGYLNAGNIINHDNKSFIIELFNKQKIKISPKDILIQFKKPKIKTLIIKAQKYSKKINLLSLWKFATNKPFFFTNFCKKYFGKNFGIIEYTSLIFRIHESPIYFQFKGKNKYKRTPIKELKNLFELINIKNKQKIKKKKYIKKLTHFELPKNFKKNISKFLFKPNKNSIKYQALNEVSILKNLSINNLLLKCGGISSDNKLHEKLFILKFFPNGINFPKLKKNIFQINLNKSPTKAFSIDDSTTIEIDDAVSVNFISNNLAKIGIHISAPGLIIKKNDEIDLIIRNRLSSIYFPGRKITMLPDEIIKKLTLSKGKYRPVLSLYILINTKTQKIIKKNTNIESIYIENNLHYDKLDDIITEKAILKKKGKYNYKKEIFTLLLFAKSLFKKRQKIRKQYGLKYNEQNNVNYNFYINNNNIKIIKRNTNLPLNLIVSELSIFTNSTWSKFIKNHNLPCIYRSQKHICNIKYTKMQTIPSPHEDLGVYQYAWTTSPLRRYIDLINQWQIISCIKYGKMAKNNATFKENDTYLYYIIKKFNKKYYSYINYQKQIEYFWCIKWLIQENKTQVIASVINKTLVKLEEIPLYIHIYKLNSYEKGTKIMIKITSLNEVDITVSAKFLYILNESNILKKK